MIKMNEEPINPASKYICNFFKMGHPRPLFHLFSPFQTNITILKTNKWEKCNVHPVYGAGIQTHNLWNMRLVP